METRARPIKREKLYNLITAALAPDKEMTAREIATELYHKWIVPYPTRGMVQPRCTELVKAGHLEVCGSKLDELTRKQVSIYRLVR